MKNIFQLFFKTMHKNCFLVLYPLRNKTSSTLTTEYTFSKYIPERSIKLSRMKVRQEPSALWGYHGKQGG